MHTEKQQKENLQTRGRRKKDVVGQQKEEQGGTVERVKNGMEHVGQQ